MGADFRAIIRVITGPARSGKTERVLGEYRRLLANSQPGRALWIAPTQRSAMELRGRLLGPDLRACFEPGIRTFASFAEAVLEASGEEIRPITSERRRRLGRRLIDEAHRAGRLTHFGPIAHTDGFGDLVIDFISELKRLEIWPDEFARACRSRGLTAKDAELLALYEAYQEILVRHRLYDQEGRFWSARTLLQGGQRRPFEKLQLVVVDGFTDFTRTQHEILVVLAERVEQLLITLPLEAEPRRSDLFAKTIRTLEVLREQHPALVEEHLPRPVLAGGRAESRPQGGGQAHFAASTPQNEPVPWPTLAHIESELFKSPRDVRPIDQVDRVEIVAASRQLGEVEQIARRIKDLLRQGVSPAEIVVAFRTLTDAAPRVREVFGELGIPFALEATQSLGDSPAVRAVLALVRLVVEDWPFRQLLALLGNNYFRPSWPEWKGGRAAIAAQKLIRELQIPSGRQALLRQVGRWAAMDPETVESNDDQHRHWLTERIHAARLALPLLERLSATLDRCCTARIESEWAGQLADLAQATGLLTVLAEPVERIDAAAIDTTLFSTALLDTAAWERLQTALAEGNQLAAWLDEQPPELTAAEMLKLLTDLARYEKLPRVGDEVGRVRVLSAPSVRALAVRYLFLAGLSEKAFPLSTSDDRLYGESELRRLIAAGLPLVDRAERPYEEMLLFYEVITRPTSGLVLSYPAFDEAAQPLSASSYLIEVERACGPGKIPRADEPDLSPVPRGPLPQSPADLRVQAVWRAMRDEPELLATLARHEPVAGLAANLTAGLRTAHARQHGDSFGPFEGVLESDAARQWLAGRFGPDFLWSASRLEQYALCPHQFFLQRVLAIEPPAELALETDYFARGQLLHGALARVHRELNAESGDLATPTGEDPQQFLERFARTLADLVQNAGGAAELDAALLEVDRRILAQWGKQYHEQHQEYEQSFDELDVPPRPAHFEVRFGPARGGRAADDDPLSTDEPFVLDLGGEQIRLSGRIDRIDLGIVAGQPVFCVLDYKSRRSTTLRLSDIEAGTALQLPLYVMAAQALLGVQATPWRSAYWFVRDSGYSDRRALPIYERSGNRLVPTEEWTALSRTIVLRIRDMVRGIRTGEFPMHSADEHCTGLCQFNTVCRVNQVRSLEKSWPPVGAPP